jgi:hypothetical protein
VVGVYSPDGRATDAYLYDGTSYKKLDPTGFAVTTYPTGVSGKNVVGFYVDANDILHGFLYNGKGFKTLDPTGSLATEAKAVSGGCVFRARGRTVAPF